jgi:hypothetical protein
VFLSAPALNIPHFPFSGIREETSCILSKIVVSWIAISELFREGDYGTKSAAALKEEVEKAHRPKGGN